MRGILGIATVVAALGSGGCARGDGTDAVTGHGLADDPTAQDATTAAGGTATDTDGLDDDDDDAAQPGTDGGEPGLDCLSTPMHPDCDCQATDDNGAYIVEPCAAHCVDQTWRWTLWVTVYNVAGTLGYGEHQGLGVVGRRYVYDDRFGPGDGIAAPWRLADGAPWTMDTPTTDAEQFAMRTLAPGGEHYVDATVVDADEDDLWPTEQHPQVPEVDAHPIIDGAALCELPEVVTDARYYNHGRTVAERVPNHAWDSFFARRSLIPMRALDSIEVTRTHDGFDSGPGTADEVTACVDVLDDGFCESRCGNCSYVMPTGYSGTPFAAAAPGYQVQGVPSGSSAPYQVDGNGQQVAQRANYSTLEDGRPVWYVGGSSWGRPEEVSGYGPDDWPDPDGVSVDPSAWMSMAGDDDDGNDAVPDEWTDPFTHCVDQNAIFGSQIPASLPRFITGRWGHNSNSDAEAVLMQFTDCGANPAMGSQVSWWNEHACAACGTPRLSDAGEPVQAPCQDTTHTATSYWEAAGGLHNIEDFDLGRYTAVGPERVLAPAMSHVPDPICRWSGEPVFGM